MRYCRLPYCALSKTIVVNPFLDNSIERAEIIISLKEKLIEISTDGMLK